MRIIKKLRNATEHGKDATQRVIGRALESGRNLERHLRQKMRIYPRPRPAVTNAAPPETNGALEEEELEQDFETEQSREPIVSVHGRDIHSPAENGKLGPGSDQKVA